MSGVRRTRTDVGDTVVLDRPGRRNALTLPMWVDLGRAARGGGREPLYLVGAGGYFCSGADLGTLAWARESPVHADAFVGGERVLLVDDVLATGGTAVAAWDLLERTGADVVAFECVVELGFLGGRSRMGPRPVGALLVVP